MILKDIRLEKRLDIFIKISYIKSLLGGTDFKKYKELYKKHILLYNGGIEDHKTNISHFENDFQKLIKNIRDIGFDKEYPIIVSETGDLINGAHRLACCIYFGIEPSIKVVKSQEIIHWGNKVIEQQFTCYELLDIYRCFAEYNNDFLIYIIWPELVNKSKDIISDISEYHHHIGSVKIIFNRYFLSEFIKDIYSYDNVNIQGGLGIDKKIIILNNAKNKYFEVAIFKKNTCKLNEVEFKEGLRNAYKEYVSIQDGTEKFYTFHSGESQKENNYLKNIVLNSNNILSYQNRVVMPDNSPIILRLSNLSKYFEKDKKNKDDYCIVGSSILDIYGLRKSHDLDLIGLSGNNKKSLQVNNDIEIFFYEYSTIISNKKLITNSENYLYFRGYKYISPTCFLKIKKHFHRKKDIHDIKLLSGINSGNNPYSNFKNSVLYFKKHLITKFILHSISITKKIGIYKFISPLWRKYFLKNI